MRCFEKWVCIIEKIVLMLKHIEIFAWTNTNAIRDRGQWSSDWVGADSYFSTWNFLCRKYVLSLGKSTYISMYNNINSKFCIFISKNQPC